MLKPIKEIIENELKTLDKDNIKIESFNVQYNLDNCLINDMKSTEFKEIIFKIKYLETKDHRHYETFEPSELLGDEK